MFIKCKCGVNRNVMQEICWNCGIPLNKVIEVRQAPCRKYERCWLAGDHACNKDCRGYTPAT